MYGSHKCREAKSLVLGEKGISWLLSPHNLGPQDIHCKLQKKYCKFQANKITSSKSANEIDSVAFCFHYGRYLEKLPLGKCYCVAQNRQYKQTNLLDVNYAASDGTGYHLARRLLFLLEVRDKCDAHLLSLPSLLIN